ncbi:hypothetical protein BKA69DRAFT_1167765 [Paraphysoderma sedebokerense]|nr:hypothetical protein BKA69DRAFT_1167765 [Paraphysoderma sedebokerense]
MAAMPVPGNCPSSPPSLSLIQLDDIASLSRSLSSLLDLSEASLQDICLNLQRIRKSKNDQFESSENLYQLYSKNINLKLECVNTLLLLIKAQHSLNSHRSEKQNPDHSLKSKNKPTSLSNYFLIGFGTVLIGSFIILLINLKNSSVLRPKDEFIS